MMRMGMVAILAFATTMSVQAKDAPAYEKGVLIQMESSSCGYAEKDGKTIAGEIFGTDGQHKNTKEVLCQEYVLQAERVTYRIRPKDDKHPVLLPVGETAQFRIHKDKLLLRVPEADGKDREYLVRFSSYIRICLVFPNSGGPPHSTTLSLKLNAAFHDLTELPLVRERRCLSCPLLDPAAT